MVLRVALVIGAIFNPGICFALGLSTPNAPSTTTTATDVHRAKFLAWFDAGRINDGGALELTHIVHVDPLPTDLDDGSHNPERLVRYASLSFPFQLPTKNRAAKALKSGRLKLNGVEKVEGCRVVQKGDQLTLQIEAPTKLSDDDVVKRMNFVGHLNNSGLSVCYEDDHLAAVFKPAGVHTKKNTVHRYLAFEDALPAILTPSSSDDALPLPLAVHRLDVRVSGLVLVAKSRRALMNLGNQFESKTVKKRYEALVVGDPFEAVKLNSDFVLRDDNSILIDSPIEVEGRGILASRTTMSVLKSMPHTHWGTLSHVQLQPETGRTHQLRVGVMMMVMLYCACKVGPLSFPARLHTNASFPPLIFSLHFVFTRFIRQGWAVLSLVMTCIGILE